MMIWIIAIGVAAVFALVIKALSTGLWIKSLLFGLVSLLILTPVLGSITAFPFPVGLYLVTLPTNFESLAGELKFVSWHTITAAVFVVIVSVAIGRYWLFIPAVKRLN
ncbi:MAG TPA: hypothetical protein PK743_10145 [Luteimonas sp.]|nr:hypothetical protein [Luteimonas sp.]